MSSIDELIDRLHAAIAGTSWRCEIGHVDPALLAQVEARVGALPDEWRMFLSRVQLLENHTGDVVFLTARDLADERSEASRAIADWRHREEETARPYPEALAEVEAFWARALPFLCSTVNGDDFLALDRLATPAAVLEAWGEGGWTDTARVCARSFGDFLHEMVDLFESGPTAFECGWRLSRKTITRLHALDTTYREPLVPIVFVTDFNAALPPRRATRPFVAPRLR